MLKWSEMKPNSDKKVVDLKMKTVAESVAGSEVTGSKPNSGATSLTLTELFNHIRSHWNQTWNRVTFCTR